jgi:hypothetical protein
MEVHIEGASSTDVLIDPGSCRDRNDMSNLVLSSQATIDTTLAHSASTGLPQSNGVDEIGLDNLLSSAITCSQTTTTITASASIYSSTEGDNLYTPYSPLSGVTMSTSGTAFTAAAGADLSQDVAIGDLVGNSSKGWSRVVSVNSSTTCTLVAALPGGNATTESWSIIHNATIWPGTLVGHRQRINTLSASGTSIVVAFSQTLSASSALTIGILARYPGDSETPWLALWSTGSGSDCYISTQHVSLLGFAPGTTPQRHVGWVKWNDEDKLYNIWYENGGINRRVQWGFAAGAATLSTTSAFVGVPVGGSTTDTPVVPRTAHYAITSVYVNNAHGSNDGAFYFRARDRGLNAGTAHFRNRIVVKASTDHSINMLMPVDGAGYFGSTIQLSTGTMSGTAYCNGWVDNLGKVLPSPA